MKKLLAVTAAAITLNATVVFGMDQCPDRDRYVRSTNIIINHTVKVIDKIESGDTKRKMAEYIDYKRSYWAAARVAQTCQDPVIVKAVTELISLDEEFRRVANLPEYDSYSKD